MTIIIYYTIYNIFCQVHIDLESEFDFVIIKEAHNLYRITCFSLTKGVQKLCLLLIILYR